MKYADLPAEQREGLQSALRLIRPTAGEFARLLGRLKAMRAGLGYQFTLGIVAALDPGELIPASGGGLDGATSLTVERLQALLALGDAVVALESSERMAACVDAAGPTNCVG
jgi:hypothetical protein